MKSLTIKDGEVYLNDIRLLKCRQIDLKNINPDEPMEVVLHVDVDEVDIQYPSRRTEPRS